VCIRLKYKNHEKKPSSFNNLSKEKCLRNNTDGRWAVGLQVPFLKSTNAWVFGYIHYVELLALGIGVFCHVALTHRKLSKGWNQKH
jgi:hypothetical protein